MRMVDLIIKKRDGLELTYEELSFIINGYINKEIPDYQMSSFLMAIYFNGLTNEETYNLSILMRDSGDILDLSIIDGVIADKHSTGGVGDKTTLVVVPILAAMGIKVAKMSGKGLGHTGGTIDKLLSIPGFKVELSKDEFISNVNSINACVIGQTGNIAKADKMIYALRDVTGSVSSIPLIASSIMSKKLASGADVICLDVKVGNGAFMKNTCDARNLAETMINIGKRAGKKVTALLSNMDEPLGYAIGNNLEVIEAINTLRGNGPKDLENLSLTICANIACDCIKGITYDDAYNLALEKIKNNEAFLKLCEIVRLQGGNVTYIENPDLFDKSKYIYELKSNKAGYINHLDALKLGDACMKLGAGRSKLDDIIDYTVGIVLNKKVNDYISKDETLMYIHSNSNNINLLLEELNSAVVISNETINNDLIIENIS